MTQPIDIPIPRNRPQGAATLGRSLFPEDEGPYFGYIEVFESGDIYRALSSGSGKYVEIGPRCTLPTLAFIVEKDRVSRSISIDITSLGLRQAVACAMPEAARTPSSSQELNFRVMLRHYDELKRHLSRMSSRSPFDDATVEMKLLVEDLALEKALYDGIGMETLRRRHLLCATHLQDIHARNVEIGLTEIGDCFKLGLMPDCLSEQYVEGLNFRVAQLARSGDYNELRALCEPVVRAGEIELDFDASLLLQILEGGHYEVFQYLLDLIERTRHTSVEILDPQYSDVTFDPLYVAIRLDQVEAVRYFISDYETFEGYVFDNSQASSDMVMTPLLAAVHWQHAEIVRLLLRSGPIYQEGFQRASALAVDRGSLEVMEALMEQDWQKSPRTFANIQQLSPAFPQQAFSVSPPDLQLSSFSGTFGSPLLPLSSSVSGITNGLSVLSSNPVPQAIPIPAAPAETAPVNNESQASIFSTPSLTDTSFLSTLQNEPDFLNLPGPSDALESIACPEPPVPFLRQTRNHELRRSLGKRFFQRLEELCAKLQGVCFRYGHSRTYAEVSTSFTAPDQIWKSGIDSLLRITKNETPQNLVEILRVLLVADTLSCQIASRGDELASDFIKDIGRWQMLLQGAEQAMFGEFVQAIWGVDCVLPDDSLGNNADKLYRFQALIQNLISPESTKMDMSASAGSRLRAVQRHLKGRKRRIGFDPQLSRSTPAPAESFQSIGSVLGRLTHDTDSFYEDELDISDFIDLTALEEEPLPTKPLPLENNECNIEPLRDVQPVVALLFASVAFSIVLTVVSAVQDDPEELRCVNLPRASPGFDRSCAVMESLMSFNPGSGSPYDSGIDVQTPREESSRWIREMKRASQRNSRIHASKSLAIPSISPAKRSKMSSLSSPSGSSFVSTDFSSDTARSPERRIKCTSCSKTFSSVSNRNKHMREGCAFREKKGYRCRHGNCTKVLTTKWYRNTHEQTRCRFR